MKGCADKQQHKKTKAKHDRKAEKQLTRDTECYSSFQICRSKHVQNQVTHPLTGTSLVYHLPKARVVHAYDRPAERRTEGLESAAEDA